MRVPRNRTSATPTMTRRTFGGATVHAETVNLKKKPYFSGNDLA